MTGMPTRDEWFIVPKYTTGDRPAPDVQVVNGHGEHVAVFEDWSDARRAVKLNNNRIRAEINEMLGVEA